jgi:hypothetical protein
MSSDLDETGDEVFSLEHRVHRDHHFLGDVGVVGEEGGGVEDAAAGTGVMSRGGIAARCATHLIGLLGGRGFEELSGGTHLLGAGKRGEWIERIEEFFCFLDRRIKDQTLSCSKNVCFPKFFIHCL